MRPVWLAENSWPHPISGRGAESFRLPRPGRDTPDTDLPSLDARSQLGASPSCFQGARNGWHNARCRARKNYPKQK
jgi:hypothetical protein